MLYYLFRFLDQYDIPGSHMWAYISFRSLLTLILSLLISAWFGEKFIKWMKRRNIFETERDPSIDPFGVEKKGVPTMGGIIIIVSILVPVLLFGRIRNTYLILMVITTVWLGFLGFLDDYMAKSRCCSKRECQRSTAGSGNSCKTQKRSCEVIADNYSFHKEPQPQLL